MLQLIYSNAQLFVTLLFSSFDKVSTNFVANAVTFVLGFNSVLGVPSTLVRAKGRKSSDIMNILIIKGFPQKHVMS